jgi:TetR/AcrR family transcriptional regulator, mexCD-oprJ operon repressor
VPRRIDALRNDQRILLAAARVLAEDPNATIQRIADEAGLVRLTVYRRYPNREALRRAIFEVAAAEATRVVDDALGRDLDVVDAVRALVVEMAVIAHRYPLLSVGTDLQPLPGATRPPTPPPQTRAMQRAVLALVRRGQEAGRLRSDMSPELFVQAVVGTLRIALRFAGPGVEPVAIGAQVADLLLGGMVDGRGLVRTGDGRDPR